MHDATSSPGNCTAFSQREVRLQLCASSFRNELPFSGLEPPYSRAQTNLNLDLTWQTIPSWAGLPSGKSTSACG
jgi:hypothetical protein